MKAQKEARTENFQGTSTKPPPRLDVGQKESQPKIQRLTRFAAKSEILFLGGQPGN